MAGKGSTLLVWSGSEEFLLFFAIGLVCCGGVFIILAQNLCKTLRLAIGRLIVCSPPSAAAAREDHLDRWTVSLERRFTRDVPPRKPLVHLD